LHGHKTKICYFEGALQCVVSLTTEYAQVTIHEKTGRLIGLRLGALERVLPAEVSAGLYSIRVHLTRY